MFRARGRRRVLVSTIALVGAIFATATLVACNVTVTQVAVADASVDADNATTTYGTTSQLIVDASPRRESFLQFDLSDQEDTLVSAVLRLHVADIASASSPDGGSVARVTGGWTEGAVTYADRPTTWGLTVGEIGAVTSNTWVEITVTQAVTIGGLTTLGIRSESTDGAYYDSRETGSFAPQLIVTTGAAPAAVSGATIAAAGDIACVPGSATTPTTCRERIVSDNLLADSAVSQFLALGDLQYENGELSGFQASYDASFGRLKAITVPMPGNHEYNTPGATGYFSYFGAAAGDPAKGYSSYDIGSTWHVVVLNSNCAVVSCAPGSAQEQWLRADLAASTRPCTLAAWHHPRFTSGVSHADAVEVGPLWDALQDHGADVVLSGHVHGYERFAPQSPSGASDAKGIQQFVVGTGGKSLHGFGTANANSLVRLEVFGYLRLVLGAKRWSWQFVDDARTVRDSGSASCH